MFGDPSIPKALRIVRNLQSTILLDVSEKSRITDVEREVRRSFFVVAYSSSYLLFYFLIFKFAREVEQNLDSGSAGANKSWDLI